MFRTDRRDREVNDFLGDFSARGGNKYSNKN